MGKISSPLRYPGGKSSLFPFIKEVIEVNNLKGCNYIEPFAGGAGAALDLLLAEDVKKLVLNDKDELIAAFWNAVLFKTNDFLRLLRTTEVSLSEYYRQREKLADGRSRKSQLQLGFAAFYVNRCNRSGILKNGTGPIGGKAQKSRWNVDARFNKDHLAERICKISGYRDQIEIYNEDAIDFLEKTLSREDIRPSKTFIYLDPPYYHQGKSLYRHYYTDKDHKALANYLRTKRKHYWMVSYDDCEFIEDLYKSEGCKPIHLHYTANNYKIGRELIIPSERCAIPPKLTATRKMKGFAHQFEPLGLEALAA